MITRIGTRAQSKLPTQFGVELSGINVGYRASTREPDFADQSLAAGLDGQNPSRGQMCCHLGKHRRLQRSSPVVLALDQACRRVVSTGLKGKGLTLPGFATPTQPWREGLCGEEDIASAESAEHG